MVGKARIVRNAAIIAVAGLVAACSPVYRTHGYVPSDEQLSMIEVGRDTRATVGDFIGQPSSAGLLRDGGWYYVGSRWKELGWRAPQEISREVVAISFDKSGTVSNVERFGLDQGRVVPLSRRVTDTNIKGVSFLGQLLGNIGVIDANQVFGDGSGN